MTEQERWQGLRAGWAAELAARLAAVAAEQGGMWAQLAALEARCADSLQRARAALRAAGGDCESH